MILLAVVLRARYQLYCLRVCTLYCSPPHTALHMCPLYCLPPPAVLHEPHAQRAGTDGSVDCCIQGGASKPQLRPRGCCCVSTLIHTAVCCCCVSTLIHTAPVPHPRPCFFRAVCYLWRPQLSFTFLLNPKQVLLNPGSGSTTGQNMLNRLMYDQQKQWKDHVLVAPRQVDRHLAPRSRPPPRACGTQARSPSLLRTVPCFTHLPAR